MDIREEFESAVEGMDCKELDSMLEEVIHDLMGQTPNPPPQASFPAGPPAAPQPATESQTEGVGSCTPLVAGPPAFVQQATLMTAPPALVPGYLYSQPGTGSQGQCNNVLRNPDSMVQYLRPVGAQNGVLVYDFASSAPPLNTPTPKKRKRHEQQDEDRPYIKKPSNAFMLFLKEQRPKVMAEFSINGSATVNAVVGERWKSLSKDQQAKYYEQAEAERLLHAQQHPDWSSKDNYGKKRRRIRGSTRGTEEISGNYTSASKPVEEAQEAKWPNVDVPVCGTFHLPRENQVLPASHTNFPASTSVASYSGPNQPQTETTFFGDTGEDLLSMIEHFESLLPDTQPQEPVLPYSDPCTGPQGYQISPDSPPSTSMASYGGPNKPQTETTFFGDTGEDLLSVIEHLESLLPDTQPQEPILPYSDPCTGPQGYEISPDSPPSTSMASYGGPNKPQTETTFFGDTGEDLLSVIEHLESLLPATQPQEPVFPY